MRVGRLGEPKKTEENQKQTRIRRWLRRGSGLSCAGRGRRRDRACRTSGPARRDGAPARGVRRERRRAELQPEGLSCFPLWLFGLHLQPLGPRVPRDRDGDGGGMWRWVRQQLVGASAPHLPDARSRAVSRAQVARRAGGAEPRGRGAGSGLGRSGGGRGPGSRQSPAQLRHASRCRARAAEVGGGRRPLPARASRLLPPPRRTWAAAIRSESGAGSASLLRNSGEGTERE
ncbi:hypothetical protein J1605_019135 [Eschrichtius robustus]|uniref:Uncharacterized protein n=1 Tax=Eschrichtius robustus TaxID=9764 RepID=A0AB34HM42_ESCRO|nr:hypothetical protein J1605_019135 [Eschrichtius robustus]